MKSLGEKVDALDGNQIEKLLDFENERTLVASPKEIKLLMLEWRKKILNVLKDLGKEDLRSLENAFTGKN